MVDEKGAWVSDGIKDICQTKGDHLIISNANARVSYGDTVVHVGDFCNKGRVNNVEGSRTKAETWESCLNGKYIFIRGNHDKNNGLKFAIETAVVEVGGALAFVQHRPIERACEVPDFCEFVICGHVHEKWRIKVIDGIINVNVGVDVNKYAPLSDSELIGIVMRFKHDSERTPVRG
jgi:calcineurin-like phosphoesterase family protein